MKSVILLSVALILVSGAAPLSAETIRVPEDFATITEAIEAAAAGDEISVAPGEYAENVAVTKSVSLISRTDLGAEIIAQEQKPPAVRFEGVEDFVTIRGFKINGYARSSACIEVVDSNIRIVGNELYYTSNGMFLAQSDAEIRGNHFHHCVGCDIRIQGSSPLIVRNRFASQSGSSIQIVGKKSLPVIGGSRGNGNEWAEAGYETVISNETKNDINARFNQWPWAVTVEMDASEDPTNVRAFYDGHDDPKLGKVDYRNWVGETGSGAVPPFVWVLAGIVVVALAIWIVVRSRSSA